MTLLLLLLYRNIITLINSIAIWIFFSGSERARYKNLVYQQHSISSIASAALFHCPMVPLFISANLLQQEKTEVQRKISTAALAETSSYRKSSSSIIYEDIYIKQLF
jgi:hypothetical protein